MPGGDYGGGGQIASGNDYVDAFGYLMQDGGQQLPREAGFANPEQVGNPLETIDFANHPALRSALKSFEAATLPGLANSLAAAGLSRSGAAGESIASAKAQMALPVMQQLMGLEMQNKGIDVGQRQQDIQSLLGQRGQDVTQRGQDVNSLLNQLGLGVQAGLQTRGQDINAALTGRGQDIQQRGQDINAALQQGAQALQGMGLNQQSMQAGLAGLMGVNEADMGRLMAGMGQAMNIGGEFREMDQAEYDALTDEQQRQYNLAREMSLGPLSMLGSLIGSSTTGSQGK